MENTRCSATWIFIDFLETTKLKKKTPVLFCILVIAIRFIKLNFIIQHGAAEATAVFAPAFGYSGKNNSDSSVPAIMQPTEEPPAYTKTAQQTQQPKPVINTEELQVNHCQI